jgi:Protein of unknown function (DUF3124)
MLKVIVVLLSILALPSCQSRQAGSQDVAQPAPTRVEPNRPAEGNERHIIGQTIYVPIYSHIYIRDKTRVINLTATLSIRNTDAQNPISITSVRYYNTEGSHIRDYIKEPLRLAPMASTDFVVAEDDTSGGAGANFIVEWGAGSEVTVPVVEAVMISTASQQGISFVSTGRVIKERLPQSSGK